MIFITDNFETPSGPHMRFRGYLKDCRECPLNNKCMKREVKNQGRTNLCTYRFKTKSDTPRPNAKGYRQRRWQSDVQQKNAYHWQ